MRLQVFLSRSGVCSRRKALDLVKNGGVFVNGSPVNEPSYDVEPGRDRVSLGNKSVILQKNCYIVLNKPPGYTTTRSDRHAKRIVFDLLPPCYRNLHPVGRLDKDSEGLLLFTNDGDLTYRILHPRFKFDKTYFVGVSGRLGKGDIACLERGVMLEGRRTFPAKVEVIYSKQNACGLSITIHEGRKRQIRLMLSSLGHRVIFLKRMRYGPLELGALKPGRWRLLKESEISLLRKACGIN